MRRSLLPAVILMSAILVGCQSTGQAPVQQSEATATTPSQQVQTVELDHSAMVDAGFFSGWMADEDCYFGGCSEEDTAKANSRDLGQLLLTQLTQPSFLKDSSELDDADWRIAFPDTLSWVQATELLPDESVTLWSAQEHEAWGGEGFWDSSSRGPILTTEQGSETCELLLDPSRSMTVDESMNLPTYRAHFIKRGEVGKSFDSARLLASEQANKSTVGLVSSTQEDQLEGMLASLSSALESCEGKTTSVGVERPGRDPFDGNLEISSAKEWGADIPGWSTVGLRYTLVASLSGADPDHGLYSPSFEPETEVRVPIFAQLMVRGKNAFWVTSESAELTESLATGISKQMEQSSKNSKVRKSQPVHSPTESVDTSAGSPSPTSSKSESNVEPSNSLTSSDDLWAEWSFGSAGTAHYGAEDIDGAGCTNPGESWSSECLKLLSGMPGAMGQAVSGIVVSYEEYGTPDSKKLANAAERAKNAAQYSREISTLAVESGCLAENKPQEKIPRAKDGKLVPCYMFFTTQYWHQYADAIQEIARTTGRDIAP